VKKHSETLKSSSSANFSQWNFVIVITDSSHICTVWHFAVQRRHGLSLKGPHSKINKYQL